MALSNRLAKNKFIFAAIFSAVFLFCFFYSSASAAVLGETKKFNVDPSYDSKGKRDVTADLILETDKLYFYVDDAVWQLYSAEEKSAAISNLIALSNEFDSKIYPILTSNYGFEWNPGIDNDPRTTILFHQLRQGAGGYFNSGNEYSRYEVPASNEREMVYINSDYIASPLLKGFLAHEFTHLITFNQKEKMRNSEEDVWLNEARAEYAITLLGYNDAYQGSNLQKRVVEFLKNPNDSLTYWKGASADYGVLNLFTHYLADQYGARILNDSLHSSYRGIESINYALKLNGYSDDFSQVFTNWTIAVAVNDCSLGAKYCYKNKNLSNIRVFSENDILPSDVGVNVMASYSAKSWTAYWNEISGDGNNLTFEFNGEPEGSFKLPYLLCDNSNKCSVNFLLLGGNNQGKITINNFNSKYSFFTIIPSVQSEDIISDFNFAWTIETGTSSGNDNGNSNNIEDETIQKLMAQIDDLKKQIAETQAKIDAILNSKNGGASSTCEISNNLYFGLVGSSQVICLQQFLKSQGPDIYPEGLVTGNFLNLTKNAVIRFQEKYADDILKPFNLTEGTGYVGEKTRAKISQLIDAK